MTTSQLPEIEEQPSLGGRLVQRIVSLTLGGLALLVLATGAVLAIVQLDVTIEAPGFLEPLEIWRVHAVHPGRVAEVLVAPGQRVQANQDLVRLDGFALRHELERLRLQARHLGARSDVARVELDLIGQSIRFHEERLARLELAAPAAGVVLTEAVDRLEGAYVDEGELLLELGSAGTWKAVLEVSELEVDAVRLGHAVKLRVPALDDSESWAPEVLAARVTFVGSELLESSTRGRGRYRVEAELETTPSPSRYGERFRRGMGVEARIITRSARALDLLVLHLERQLGLDG